VTEEMLESAANSVRLAAQQMRTNEFSRAPQGDNGDEWAKTCERCDLAGICGSHTYPASAT